MSRLEPQRAHRTELDGQLRQRIWRVRIERRFIHRNPSQTRAAILCRGGLLRLPIADHLLPPGFQELRDSAIGPFERHFIGQEHDAEMSRAWRLSKAAAVDDKNLLLDQ
jgi:hypothetical protein